MLKLTSLDITLSSMFSALTALGAYLIIPLPFTPVPLTFQTFFTYTAGAVLGRYRGMLSQIIYIGLGSLGFPIFGGGKAGIGVLLGPTGGYLIGFVLAAFIIGFLVKLKKKPGYPAIILAMFAGTFAVYLLGIIQLSVWMGISLKEALLVGAIPFLPGDMLKIFAAALVSVRVIRIFPMLHE
jgi:biotin transport system substrate-specific component